MKDIGLSAYEIELISSVLVKFPEISTALLYGSRAKGTFAPHSDIDLALTGIENDLKAQAVADELDMLPLPYKFDVKAYAVIQNPSLKEHIDRVGIVIYKRQIPA